MATVEQKLSKVRSSSRGAGKVHSSGGKYPGKKTFHTAIKKNLLKELQKENVGLKKVSRLSGRLEKVLLSECSFIIVSSFLSCISEGRSGEDGMKVK